MKYVVIFLLFGLMLMHVRVGSDWTCYKGSPERTSSTDVSAPDTAYLLWKIDVGSALYSSPVVLKGRVFQVGAEEIVCIDLDTGEVLWTAPVPAYHSTPALSNDKVLVATNRGVSALSIEDGSMIWEYVVAGRFSTWPLEDYIVSSPAISNSRVVVGTRPYEYKIADGDGPYRRDELYVICLDETNGEEQWYVRAELGVFSSPCVAYGKVFAASREILCIDLGSGKVLWNSEHKYPFDLRKSPQERYVFDDSTPALYHGFLVGGSYHMEWKKIVAMDQYTGDIIWEWIERGGLASSPALYEGKIYSYSHDGFMRCLSLLDGGELWATSISRPRNSEVERFRLWPSPAIADGKVYIGSVDGIFFCLDANTGEILWGHKTDGPSHSVPAITSGKVLISSTGGMLYCFGIDPETYKMKADQYIENEDYGRAEEFLIKVKEYAEDSEDIARIDELLDTVQSKMPEYQNRMEKLSEAESLMDEADKIIWDKKFEEAKNLYVKAHEIFEEVEDELGISFCENRISYIHERITLQEKEKAYSWLLIVLFCIAIASVFLIGKYIK